MKGKKIFLIALLMTIAAVSFGGRPAVAQQANATDVVGGPGGRAFLDPDVEPGARVVEVQVHSGEFVDSVQLVYMLGDGRTVAGPLHGGPGGQLGVFRLDPDEYLTGASGPRGRLHRFHTISDQQADFTGIRRERRAARIPRGCAVEYAGDRF